MCASLRGKAALASEKSEREPCGDYLRVSLLGLLERVFYGIRIRVVTMCTF